MDTQQIRDYLLQNPIDRSKQNPYDEAAKALGIRSEAVRSIWRRMRQKGLVEKYKIEDNPIMKISNLKHPSSFSGKDGKWQYTMPFADVNEYKEDRRSDGSVQIQDTVDRKLTDAELFARYGRNQKEWKIISIWFKDKANGFLLSVHFAPIKQTIELNNQKELILEEMKNYRPKQIWGHVKSKAAKYLYEIAIPDLHIGKLAWGKEVGEDYDINIAVKRYKDAIETLLDRIEPSEIERFLLPIGNDMLNIDNNASTTTAGTPQQGDSRFGKMFLTAKNLLIETIDRLTALAPVDVVIVAGNHDNLNMFTLGEVLSAWYHNDVNVHVDNAPMQRKYYKYGKTGIQFTHGNQEKHLELGLIFATEEPQLWADTKFRFCQLGHYHHTKKTQYVSVQEHQGFQVQIIPSLSGTDAWHYGKGYNSMKQAKAFLIHKDEGIIGEFTYTV